MPYLAEKIFLALLGIVEQSHEVVAPGSEEVGVEF
jgi:hypothetical protein